MSDKNELDERKWLYIGSDSEEQKENQLSSLKKNMGFIIISG